MARNKYPEETKRRIIEAAAELFMEKGYDNTSIDDITGRLDGLTKGAVYHHFRSKEEIYDAVLYQVTSSADDELMAVVNSKGLNGREKLKQLFAKSMTAAVQNEISALAPDYSKNPKLLYQMLLECKNEIAPLFLLPVIQEGIQDGSIESDSPRELSEFLAFVLNFWLNPCVIPCSAEESLRKFKFFSQVLKAFQLDLMEEPLMEKVKEFAEKGSCRKQENLYRHFYLESGIS